MNSESPPRPYLKGHCSNNCSTAIRKFVGSEWAVGCGNRRTDPTGQAGENGRAPGPSKKKTGAKYSEKASEISFYILSILLILRYSDRVSVQYRPSACNATQHLRGSSQPSVATPPPTPPAPLQRTPPRPGHTANAIFKMIQGWTFDGSRRKIVPRRSDSVGEKVSTRCMTSFTSKNT